jgi:hypothetical protein
MVQRLKTKEKDRDEHWIKESSSCCRVSARIYGTTCVKKIAGHQYRVKFEPFLLDFKIQNPKYVYCKLIF